MNAIRSSSRHSSDAFLTSLRTSPDRKTLPSFEDAKSDAEDLVAPHSAPEIEWIEAAH